MNKHPMFTDNAVSAKPTVPPMTLLTPKEAAEQLKVSLSWLAKARLSGAGPRFVKIGRSVRYPEPYIRDYVRQQTRSSTSEM